MHLATCAQFAAQFAACLEPEVAQHEQGDGVAQDPAQALVARVRGAQHVAVQQQHAFAVQVDHRAVLEQRAPRFLCEAAPHEEIAVAMHEIGGHTRVSQHAQLADDLAHSGVGIVIAEPRFEQVAQDVQRACCTRLATQEADELARDAGHRRIQVQVRDQ